MTETEAKFEKMLFQELNRLGVYAIPEFRVPGANTILDVYIASPVRAFVEIKFGSSPSTLNIRRLLQQSEDIRQKFGGEIMPILVAGDQQWRSSTPTQRLRDAGFFILNLSGSVPSASAARHCAKEIRDFLVRLPYQFKGIDDNFAPPAPISEALGARPLPSTKSQKSSSEETLASIKRILAEEDAAKAADQAQSLQCPPAPPRSNVMVAHAAPQLRDLRPPSDIFTNVLVSLKSVLSPDQFEVLEHELAAFSEEYRHEHYTACALRIGRTIEHVVYALARSWGVEVNQTTLQVLSGLRNSFEQLSKTVITYAASDESAKDNRRKAVQAQCEQVSTKLLRLAFDLDSHERPESTDLPVNVESIVRDIKKQFAARKKVLETVDAIIKGDVLRKILDVRNDAAHASTSGARRELNKNEIDAAVELLRIALFLFGNVAFAVAEKNGRP
jgi:hypothetical protein